MTYSKKEKFAWLKHAELLAKSRPVWQGVEQLEPPQRGNFLNGEMPKELREKLLELGKKPEYVEEILKTIELHPNVIRDFCKVRQSLDKATTILLSLGAGEVSVNELDKGENETGITYDYANGFHVNLKKTELSRIAATGAEGNWDHLIAAGIITAEEIKKARRRKRRPLFDANRIGIVGRFLVDNWCGRREGVYGMWKNCFFETADRVLSEKVGVVPMGDSYVCKKSPSFFFDPPLCFFENGALAMFCATALRKTQDDPETTTLSIRKWISRLGLKHASCPKIAAATDTGEGIYFTTR